MKREELLVNAKPILFNSEMVKAILEDRKTVTRRVIKLPKWVKEDDKELDKFYFSASDRGDSGVISKDDLINYLHLNPYQVGDILYVRETWNLVYDYDDDDQIIWDSERYVYYADNPMPFTHWITEDGDYLDQMPWKPSIHMPKEAARIFLKVTNVRVERLQDITEEEAMQEGIIPNIDSFSNKLDKISIELFSDLWNSTINKKDLDSYSWEANPYVWVIEFERIEVEV